MNTTLKTYISILFALVLALPSFANDDVTFTASAPKTVAVGESFQLVYTLNTSGKDLRLPALDAFEVIAGPFSSTSSSVQYINGDMTSTKTVRYTYTLLANKQGQFSIVPASIIAKKEKRYSNALNIKVIAAEDKAEPSNQSSQNNTASTNLSEDNLFVKASASRTKIKEQEAVLLTYKIYSRVDLVDIQNVKFPELPSLLVQEIDDNNQNIQADRENINGKIYTTYQIKRYLVFPQHSGKIEILPFSCDAVVRIRQKRQSRSIFDDFFDQYQDVAKSLKSKKIILNVESLPSPKPANFSGAVGKFSITSDISANELKTNESLTLKIKIAGSGNLKLVKTPELDFPTDFEVYEPKVSNNIKPTTSGLIGSKTIEYLVIPRHNGQFSIPSQQFTYFDTDQDKYITLSTDVFNINVLKGDESEESTVFSPQQQSISKEKVRQLATDIRYISAEKIDLKPYSKPFAGSIYFWLIHLFAAFIAMLLMLIFRKRIRDNANVALMRNKKANKMALRKLKVAKSLMEKQNKELFYDEILKALWGYLADKIAISTSKLNKDNVMSELLSRSVDNETINTFINLLNDCEFARYAPVSNPSDAMLNTYNSAADIISKLESSIKRI